MQTKADVMTETLTREDIMEILRLREKLSPKYISMIIAVKSKSVFAQLQHVMAYNSNPIVFTKDLSEAYNQPGIIKNAGSDCSEIAMYIRLVHRGITFCTFSVTEQGIVFARLINRLVPKHFARVFHQEYFTHEHDFPAVLRKYSINESLGFIEKISNA